MTRTATLIVNIAMDNDLDGEDPRALAVELRNDAFSKFNEYGRIASIQADVDEGGKFAARATVRGGTGPDGPLYVEHDFGAGDEEPRADAQEAAAPPERPKRRTRRAPSGRDPKGGS